MLLFFMSTSFKRCITESEEHMIQKTSKVINGALEANSRITG